MRNEVEAYEENKSSIICVLLISEIEASSIKFSLFGFKMMGQLSSPGPQNGGSAPCIFRPRRELLDAQTLRVLRVY